MKTAASVRALFQACSDIVEAAPTGATDAVDLSARRDILLATIDCVSQVCIMTGRYMNGSVLMGGRLHIDA